MYPILFNEKEKDFISNGLGRLSDSISCVVTEERNGSYELAMEYPMSGVHFTDIKHSRIILAKPFVGGRLQPFRIYDISKSMNGKIRISAEHISYQLNHIPVSKFSAVGASGTLNGLKSNAAEECPFTFETDIDSSVPFDIETPGPLRSFLGGQEGSVIDTFGGEYEWDRYNVKLHKSRGRDKGITIRYGKNLIDLTQEENIQNTITGLYPFWKGSVSQETTDVNGNTTSEQVDVYIELPEKVVHSTASENYPYQRTSIIDFSSDFEEPPSIEDLRQYTIDYIQSNNIGVPSVSLDVNFVNLLDKLGNEDIEELRTINLCDIVTIQFLSLGVNATAKVIKTVYDVINERYTSIEVGDAKSSLSSTINSNISAISDRPTTSQVNSSISSATRAFRFNDDQGNTLITVNANGLSGFNTSGAQTTNLSNRGLACVGDRANGISAGSATRYLWAGYSNENDFIIVADNGGLYTVYNGVKYNIGQEIAAIKARLGV